MTHHHPSHPHRHHIRIPEPPPSDNSLFWLIVICLVALLGFGYWLSLTPKLVIAEPPAIEQPAPPISADIPQVLPPEERTASVEPEPEPDPLVIEMAPVIEPMPEPITEPAPITIHVTDPVRHHIKPQHHHRAKEPTEHHAKPAHKRKPAKPVHHRRPESAHAGEPDPEPDHTPVWNDPSKYPYIPDEMRE